MALKDDILALREAGLSYGQIKEQLGCSKSTVGYHLSEKAREHSRNRNRKRRKANPLLRKVEVFQSEKEPFVPQPKKSSIAKDQRNKVTHFHKEHAGGQEPRRFTFQDVLDKFGSTPRCYLTGRTIDWSQPQTYTFDHIHPRAKGGTNSLDNLGVCIREANQVKSDLFLDELLNLCEEILRYHGRTVV